MFLTFLTRCLNLEGDLPPSPVIIVLEGLFKSSVSDMLPSEKPVFKSSFFINSENSFASFWAFHFSRLDLLTLNSFETFLLGINTSLSLEYLYWIFFEILALESIV